MLGVFAESQHLQHMYFMARPWRVHDDLRMFFFFSSQFRKGWIFSLMYSHCHLLFVNLLISHLKRGVNKAIGTFLDLTLEVKVGLFPSVFHSLENSDYEGRRWPVPDLITMTRVQFPLWELPNTTLAATALWPAGSEVNSNFSLIFLRDYRPHCGLPFNLLQLFTEGVGCVAIYLTQHEQLSGNFCRFD